MNELVKHDRKYLSNVTPLVGLELKEYCRRNMATIDNLRLQVINGLQRNFEIRMIFETAYRARGVAKTDIGLVVFEANKYSANGFDVLEVVPLIEDSTCLDCTKLIEGEKDEYGHYIA